MGFGLKLSSLVRLCPLVPALALALPLVAARPAQAQSQGVKIAVVNPSRIFNEMKETKALQGRMAQEQQKFMTEKKAKETALEQLKASRDALNPNHPQYEELNNQLMRAALEYKVWVESQRAMAEHTQKRQMKTLFEKIQGAIAEVAKQQGTELVIADSRDPLPTEQELERMTPDALRMQIIQKDVLYVNDRLDISQSVLALLDARFAGANGAPSAGAVGGAAPLINQVGGGR